MIEKKANVYDFLMYLLILLFTIFCFVPILVVISGSFTDEGSLVRYGYHLIPRVFSLEAYTLMFKNGASVLNSYLVTIIITAAGTAAAMIITLGAAYCLANRRVRYRNALAFYFFFTMLFSGGLVPWYLVNTYLGLRNNIGALIIPSLMFNAFNMFLVRNYMAGIPDSLMESATIDGAGEFTIALKIYYPLCLPVIAAVSLFYAIGYWNDWWNAIMLVDNKNLYPLQFFLFKIQSEAAMLRELQQMGMAVNTPPANSLKMATCVVTMGPIVFLYPFLQRYFIQGLVIGSVKG
jgi:putative aldouronate transport system permease protein